MTIKPRWDSKSAGEYERRLKAEREDDDDIQDYKKPWVGLTIGETAIIVKMLERGNFMVAVAAIEAKLKEKNA